MCVLWGVNSLERSVQNQRERSVLAETFFSRMNIPPSASEPEFNDSRPTDGAPPPAVIPLYTPQVAPLRLVDAPPPPVLATGATAAAVPFSDSQFMALRNILASVGPPSSQPSSNVRLPPPAPPHRPDLDGYLPSHVGPPMPMNQPPRLFPRDSFGDGGGGGPPGLPFHSHVHPPFMSGPPPPHLPGPPPMHLSGPPPMHSTGPPRNFYDRPFDGPPPPQFPHRDDWGGEYRDRPPPRYAPMPPPPANEYFPPRPLDRPLDRPPERGPPERVDNRFRVPCRFFDSRGGCRNGDDCPFLHEKK
jgi:hypothetical protein